MLARVQNNAKRKGVQLSMHRCCKRMHYADAEFLCGTGRCAVHRLRRSYWVLRVDGRNRRFIFSAFTFSAETCYRRRRDDSDVVDRCSDHHIDKCPFLVATIKRTENLYFLRTAEFLRMSNIFELFNREAREVSINIHCGKDFTTTTNFSVNTDDEDCLPLKTKRQKFTNEKVDNEQQQQHPSARVKLLRLANMIGLPQELHGRIATPVVRCSVIEDCSRCVVRLRSKENPMCFGEFASLFSDFPASFLGKGVSSKVLKVEFCGRKFAVKTTPTDEMRHDLEKNKRLTKVWMAEPRIASFLTEHFVGLRCPTIARCPHFVAQFAYECTNVIPELYGDVTMPLYMKKNTAVVSLSEVFDLKTAMHLVAQETSFLSVESRAFSLIAQVLIAISCLQTIGVSHNDMRLENIFAHSTVNSTLRYQFPGEKLFDPSGMLCIRSQGVLFAVGDFGIASCTAWEESGGDMRFDKPNLEYGRHATLGCYYYEDRQQISRKNGMMCLDSAGNIVHPLRCDVDTMERDISFFLTQIVVEADKLQSNSVALYARNVLNAYNVAGRLQSAKQIMEITKRVLSREFTSATFGAETAENFYGSSECLPGHHVYILPNEFDGQFMERELAKLLDQEYNLDSLFRLSKEL